MRVTSPGRFILVVGVAVAGPLDAQATHAGVNKPLSRVEPICRGADFIFETADGRHICWSPGFDPCPAGQVLDRPASGVASCKPSKHPPIACPTGQIPFQASTGKQTCIAEGSNPCPQGQELDFASMRYGVMTCTGIRAKTLFTCPAGLIAFQRSDGKMLCIAPDSNPCPQGQLLDKASNSGIASCKPLSAKAPLACPAGQVRVQQPSGKFVCVASP